MADNSKNPPVSDPYDDIYNADDPGKNINDDLERLNLNTPKNRYVPPHIRNQSITGETAKGDEPPPTAYRPPFRRTGILNEADRRRQYTWDWRGRNPDPAPQENDPTPIRVAPNYPPNVIPENLIQHGRSTPGYPRWRRTQAEINAAAASNAGPRPPPEPAVHAPYLGPRASTLEEEAIFRMSYRGHWYLKSLPVLSRYFTREPAEKAAIISGEEHDPYDLVLVIKDAHTLQEPEDFVEAVMRELANTGEYSRDMAAHDQIGVWGARATRRTHTNLAGRDLLEDFDLIIEELINLQCELERSNRANSADRLFETIADAYGWDSTELKKSGFHQEIMTYVSQAMTGRLRYMRDSARWNSPPGQQNQTIGDEPSIVLSTRYFSSALHSACIADDIRTVEWFSNWAALFPGRHSREFSSPKIDTNMILELFQQVYLTPYKNAVRLVSDSGFAEDVYIIDSYIAYIGSMNTLEPQRKPFIAETTEQYFKPYVKKLNELLDKYPVTNGTFWQKYRASPRSVPDLRNRLMKHMDASDMPTYIGIGRWCRHTPFMGKTEAAAEVKEAQQKLWAKGWYCHDHRPWLRCTSCGWKYSCAICANPHTCPHCKQGFRCNWEGCDARSNRGPDGSAPRHTYHIAETVNGEGWQQNGRRITPRVQLMMNRLHQPPVYRRFFPKSVSDIPRDGIISVRPISIRQDRRSNPIRGGWGDAPGYPVKEANYYDERVGAEGIKFVEEWEGPRGVPGGQAGKALVEEITEDEGKSGKGKKRKREAEKRLLGDVTSALRAVRRVRR